MVPTQFFNNSGMLEFAGVTCLNISDGMRRRGLHSLTSRRTDRYWTVLDDESIVLIVTKIRNFGNIYF